MMKLAGKINNPVLAFNASLFLNSPQDQQQILKDCGYEGLAELANEAETGDLS